MSIFDSLSWKSRALKMRLLRARIPLHASMRVLDVGGEVGSLRHQLMRAFPRGTDITVVNIDRGHLDRVREECPQIRTVCADARKLPFEDDAFDLVYSNAVIEHVGGASDQRAMAREIMRVGRGWFVSTPNRWFPFEFHMRLPLVSWLAPRGRAAVGRVISWNHVKQRYTSGLTYPLRLLAAGDLRALFPGSRVLRCRVTFWPETLVAAGSKTP